MVGLSGPEEARAFLASVQSRVEAAAARAQQVNDRLAELRATVSDDNGLVELTVDSSGNLVDIHLTERIRRASPDVVSRAILDTVRAAKAQMAAQSKAVVVETMGADSAAGRMVTDSMATGLGDPPDWPGRR